MIKEILSRKDWENDIKEIALETAAFEEFKKKAFRKV
jgi:hypothetical protein